MTPSAQIGLDPLPTTGRSGTSPRLDMSASEQGIITAAYHSGLGVAELELTFTQRESKSRLGAWLVLGVVLVIGVAGWTKGRRGE